MERDPYAPVVWEGRHREGAPLSRSRTMRQYIKGWITQWDLRRLQYSEVGLVSESMASNYARKRELGRAARIEHRGALAGRAAILRPRAAQPAFGFTWRAPLPRYQQAGIARLLAEPGMLQADEMGLGKTIQAIGALRVLLRDGALEPALVVVPAGTRAAVAPAVPRMGAGADTVHVHWIA